MQTVSFKLTDNVDLVKRSTQASINAALEGIGLHIEGEAKEELENSPRRVDTGNLKNSISHSVNSSENAVYIGTNVNYAPYVHEGTRRMAPNRFLKNAVEHNADQLPRYFEEHLDGALR